MAVIRETYVLEDKASGPLGRIVQGMEQGAGAAYKAQAASMGFAAGMRGTGAAVQAAQGSMQQVQSAMSAVEGKLVRLNAVFEAQMREQERLAASGNMNSQAFAGLDKQMEKTGAQIRLLEDQYGALAAQASALQADTTTAAEEQSKMSRALEETNQCARRVRGGMEQAGAGLYRASASANALYRSLKRVAGAYMGLRGAKAFGGLSDSLAQIKARLDRMNDGLQTTEQLNQMIFASAMRSRGAYADTADLVGKLGTLAGDAFGSNGEAVAFAEQINKHLALSGTSAAGAQSAVLQLTQAMSSGVLRGEELNSILKQTPTIAQSIADYIGVSVGEMRELAADGRITADIVKGALFSAAEETNKQFEQIPMTFSQAFAMAGNAAVAAFEPAAAELSDLLNSDLGGSALQGLIGAFQVLGNVAAGAVNLIGTGLQWVRDNWEIVSTVLIGGALTVAGVMIKAAISSAASWMAANWPLLLIAAGIALLVTAARKMGVTFEQMGAFVGGVFGALYAFIMNNFVVPIQHNFALLANFVGNLFNNPVAAVKVLFLDLATYIVNQISSAARAIESLVNRIPGVKVDLTSGLNRLQSSIETKSRTIKDAAGWKEYVKSMEFVDYGSAVRGWSGKGAELGSKLDNFSLRDTISGLMGGMDMPAIDAGQFVNNDALKALQSSLGDIGADVRSIKKEVSMSDEDLKYLEDRAQRAYVNNVNLTSQTPVINIRGQNTGDTAADRKALAETLKQVLMEQAAAGSYRATARAF